MTTKSTPYSSNAFGSGWCHVSITPLSEHLSHTHLEMNAHFDSGFEQLGEQATDLTLQVLDVLFGAEEDGAALVDRLGLHVQDALRPGRRLAAGL